MRFIIIILAIYLSACSVFTDDENLDLQNKDINHFSKPQMSEFSAHHYSEQIALELLQQFRPIKPNTSIAVGTLVPVNTLTSISEKGPSKLIGLQMQEGLTTAVAQLGFEVIEYKTLPKIILKPGQDSMLSRDVSQLKEKHKIDYFITGTFTEVQDQYIVNVKLIDSRSNVIHGAATKSVPLNAFWSQEKVQLRDGSLIRNHY
jgi:TolB-like protein